MFNFILIVIFLILFATIGQLSLIIGFVLKCIDKNLALKYYRAIARFVLKTLLFLSGYKILIKNKEIIDEINNNDEPMLFVSSHKSIFDIITFYSLIDKPVCFISKIELSKIPIFSLWMKNIGALFLDRNDLRQGMQVIVKAIDIIKNNESVYICPEGTRNKNADQTDLLEFKEGSFSIAKKTNCKIIPIAVYYENNVFENQFPFLKKTIIKIEFDNGFYPKDIDENTKISEYSYNIVKNMLISLKSFN